MKKDYQTHVFTSTYTADVSGVCSAMYELGGMSVLHDPSGCNSTYSTHDEPRWFDTDSLMFVSGLDEITAVMGDDRVLIRDVTAAARDLNPRFITLCGASIPHIIAFDYRGVAALIERECRIPVLPVATDGLKSYVSGAGKALWAWIDRFAAREEYRDAPENSVNLVGVTPLDFSVGDNVRLLRETLTRAGFKINCCMAMGESFESMCHAYRARVNVVVSSAGRLAAKGMRKACGMPYVEGLPIGPRQAELLVQALGQSLEDGRNREAYAENRDVYAENRNAYAGDRELSENPSRSADGFAGAEGGILVIGEEIFARSLVSAINLLPPKLRENRRARPLWPDVDMGIAEDDLIPAMRSSHTVIADPLYKVVLRSSDPVRFIPFPHEAYSGRIFRKDIPAFAGEDFSVANLLNGQ